MSAERERDRASGGGAEDVAAMASKAPARTETSGFRLAHTPLTYQTNTILIGTNGIMTAFDYTFFPSCVHIASFTCWFFARRLK